MTTSVGKGTAHNPNGPSEGINLPMVTSDPWYVNFELSKVCHSMVAKCANLSAGPTNRGSMANERELQ